MTATSAAASSLPPVRTTCHVPLSLMSSISEETISLWLKLGALEKLEQAVLDGYGDQLCGKTSRIPQVNKFLRQVPLFQSKIKEIHRAVSQGRLRDVQHLIDRKKLAFCRDHTGATPLHKAVIFAHQDIIEYLVARYGGVIHVRDHQGRTPLHYAAFLPDGGEIYQFLLAAGSDERAMDVYGRQPSYYVDASENENLLRQLREGANVNGVRKTMPRYSQCSGSKQTENGMRPVISKMQVRELIAEGSLDALEDLVLQGHGDRLLGETSKDPRTQTFLNIVPIYMERIYDVHRAVMRDQLEHVVILLENRRLAMARDQLGATPLHKAVWFGHYKIAHYISHHFPETLNTLDLEGRTPLHYAAALRDNKHMYSILLEAGANKGIFDNKGKTPDYYLQYAEHLNLDEVIKRCHKVNANYLANTANRIKGKSPTRQTPPPSNGNSSSPRSEDNNGSSKESGFSADNGTEPEHIFAMLQKDNLAKRADMSSANIRRWVQEKDVAKLERAVMEGYGERVVRIQGDSDVEDEKQSNEDLSGKMTRMVERINAIHSAVSNDDLTELQSQLHEKDYALAKDHMGMTPLHRAVLLGRTNILKYLIDKFPETINVKNKDGRTALHYAAAMSRKDGQNLYKLLLQGGADPKIRDNHGRTADYYKTHLLTLSNKGSVKARAGARHSEPLNRYSKQGVLERMTAALQRGDVELLQELALEGHGRHLIGKTSWNEDVRQFLKELPSYLGKIQSLHAAAKIGDVEGVRDIINSNEKLLKARDETGAFPVHAATQVGQTEVVEYLINSYPAVLTYKDGLGRTALHIAAQNGDHKLYRLLRDGGADVKILDQKGRTAEFYLQNAKHEPNSSRINGSLDVARVGALHAKPANTQEQKKISQNNREEQNESAEAEVSSTAEAVAEEEQKPETGSEEGKPSSGEDDSGNQEQNKLEDSEQPQTEEAEPDDAVTEEQENEGEAVAEVSPERAETDEEKGDVDPCEESADDKPPTAKDDDGKEAEIEEVTAALENDATTEDTEEHDAEETTNEETGDDDVVNAQDNDDAAKDNDDSYTEPTGSPADTSTEKPSSAENDDAGAKDGDDATQNTEEAEEESPGNETAADGQENEEEESPPEAEAEEGDSTDRPETAHSVHDGDEAEGTEEERTSPSNEIVREVGSGRRKSENGGDAEADNESEKEDNEADDEGEGKEEEEEEGEEKDEEEKGEEKDEEEKGEEKDDEAEVKEAEEENGENEEPSRDETGENQADDTQDAKADDDGAENEQDNDDDVETEVAKAEDVPEESEAKEDDVPGTSEAKEEQENEAEEEQDEAAEDEAPDSQPAEGNEKDTVEKEEENNDDGGGENNDGEEESPAGEETEEAAVEEADKEDGAVDEDVKEDAEASEGNHQEEQEEKTEEEKHEGDNEGLEGDQEESEEPANKDDEEDKVEDPPDNEEGQQQEVNEQGDNEDDQADDENNDTEQAGETSQNDVQGEGVLDAAEDKTEEQQDHTEDPSQKDDGTDDNAANDEDEKKDDAQENSEQKEENEEDEGGESRNEEKSGSAGNDGNDGTQSPHEDRTDDPENQIEATESYDENPQTEEENTKAQSHQTKDHLDELIEHWIREGDLLRLEHVVLAGQGERLIERTSDDKQVQDFLDLVPIYMAKIRAVHEAVVRGQLRDVRSILTRKRFALSRDHVGASPLHLAVLHGHADVATYIISHFPETMDGPDNEGRTPLHYASALPDNGALYKILKAAGADENIEDKSGRSPKYYLNHRGELTLSELLEPYSITE